MLRVAARGMAPYMNGTLHEHGTRASMSPAPVRIANKKTLAAKARGLSDKRSFDFAKTQK